MKELGQIKWESMCANVVNKMIDSVQPYLTPISKELSKIEGEHLGSASYIEFKGIKYIITNEHVLEHLQTHSLTHQFHGNNNIIRISKSAISESAPVDAAISEIPTGIWNLFEHIALAIPQARFAQYHNPVENELLFFAGYSGERSKFIFGELVTRLTPYLTQICPFPVCVKEALLKYHFSLLYQPDLALSVEGSSHLPDPHGFSGSLVWDTKFVACLKDDIEWDPEMAKVTGIVWGWPSAAACILATKIEYLDINKLANYNNPNNLRVSNRKDL